MSAVAFGMNDRLLKPPIPDPRVAILQQYGLESPEGTDAFDSIYHCYTPRILAISRGILSRMSHPDPHDTAADVVQDTWFKASDLLVVDFKADCPVLPFLTVIAKRRCLDTMEKLNVRRHLSVLDPNDESFMDSLAAWPISHADHRARRAVSEQLMVEAFDLLSPLPYHQRRLLTEIGIGARVEELATQYDVPLGTMKSRVRAARKAARALMIDAELAAIPEVDRA